MQNQVQWQEVSNDTMHFRISMAGRGWDQPSDYIVGVARQVRQGGLLVSSGLTWARCVYRKNTGKNTGSVTSSGFDLGTLRLPQKHR